MTTPVLTVANVFVGEQEGVASIQLRLSQPPTTPVSVRVTTQSATGTEFGDIADQDLTVTFAPGQTLQTISIPVTDDTFVEPLQSVYVVFSNPSGLLLGTASTLLTIVDNDGDRSRTPAIVATGNTVNETDGSVTFTLRLTRPSDRVVSVDVATEARTASANADFTPLAIQTISFAPGETVRRITVNIQDDAQAEGREAFALTLANAVNATIATPSALAAIAPSDQPTVSIPTLSVDHLVVGEADGVATFEVRLSAPSTTPVTATLFTSSATGTDFGDIADRRATVTFAPGETVRTVQVALEDDSILEPFESVYFTFTDIVGATTATNGVLLGIVDNDRISSVSPSVIATGVTVNETDQTASVVLRLDQPSNVPISVDVSTVDNTATAGSDFLSVAGRVTFAPGETVRTVSIPLLDDGTAEGQEAFALRLANVAGGTIATPSVEVVIGESDTPLLPQPFLNLPDVVVGEADGFITVVLRLSGPSASPVRAELNTQSATGSEFGDISDTIYIVTFAPGETVRTARIPLADDMLSEVTEGIYLVLSDVTGALVSRTSSIASIVDNDSTSAQAPGITVDDTVVLEDEGAAIFTVRLTNQGSQPVAVDVLTVGGSAVSGTDFLPVTQRLTFAPGETVKAVRVAIVDDTTTEGLEDFAVVLSGASGATILDGVAFGNIGPSEQATVSQPVIAVTSLAVHEIQGTATVGLILNAPSTLPVSVQLDTRSGTGTDFGDIADRGATVTFAPGETLQTLQIAIDAGIPGEPLETIFVDLRNPTNALIGNSSGTLTIADTLTPLLSASGAVVREGTDAEARFDLTLSVPSTSTVSVQVATGSVSATAGADFTTVNRTITFQPGQTTASFSVPIANDAAVEGPEAFQVVLSNPVGAVLRSAQGTMTTVAIILDDEGAAPSPPPPPSGRNPATEFLVDGRVATPSPADGAFGLRFVFTASDAGQTIVGTSDNDLINALGGIDAVDGGAGNDIVDGGTGSNFLTGGSGRDIFFVDGRGTSGATGNVVFSTVTDFDRGAGEQLTVFGWRQGISRVLLTEETGGAPGFQGATFHLDLDGDNIFDASFTLTGQTVASVQFSTGTTGNTGFLLIG